MNWILALLLLPSLTLAKGHRVHKRGNAKTASSNVRLTKVETCAANESKKKVMVIKQWHLAPKSVTKGFKEKYPQEKNQTAIYKTLEEGVKRADLQLIVSEGCEGEIDENFAATFNGWDYASLKVQSQTKNYDKILTLVPLKVEAKYGAKITTLCGDSDALIQEGNKRLSNLRGWLGFYAKLSKGDEETVKLFSGSAADLLQQPKDTPTEKILEKIKEQIRVDLAAFFKSLSDRNDSFVKTLSAQDYEKAAIVVGGLHASDLKEKLEKAGLGCEVYEPPGYQREDENLIQEFQKALN